MKKGFVLLLLLFFLNNGVLAITPLTMIAESPDKTVKVTLIDEPCTGKAAELLTYVPEDVFKATLTTDGVTLEACWKATPEGVAIILETGEQGLIPFQMFKPAENI